MWRFVFIARVVPIKGLTDLVKSLALLRDAGLDNFHLDVLGPKNHMPWKVMKSPILSSSIVRTHNS